MAGIQFVDVAGSTTLRYGYYSSGSVTFTTVAGISIDTWYRIEFKYDIDGNLWDWRIDGVSQNNGALSAATRTPQKLRIGCAGSTAAGGVDTVLDEVAWRDDDWPGYLPSAG